MACSFLPNGSSLLVSSKTRLYQDSQPFLGSSTGLFIHSSHPVKSWLKQAVIYEAKEALGGVNVRRIKKRASEPTTKVDKTAMYETKGVGSDGSRLQQ